MYYCTLYDAKSVMAAGAESKAVEDDALMRAIKQVTTRINQMLVGRSEDYVFLPQIKTRSVEISGRVIDSRRNLMALKWPLLAIASISADGTSITSAASGYPQGETPYRQIRISGSSWYSYISASCGDVAYAEFVGIWGWHSDYANAWQLTGATLAAALNASDTEPSTSGVDDDDLYGYPNRLSRGALIKIDDEFMLVTATNKNTNKATVKRAVLGSAAAEHDSAAAISMWQVEEPIRRVTARQAAFMYARRGSYEQSSFDGAQSVQYPADLLRELAEVLTEYANA